MAVEGVLVDGVNSMLAKLTAAIGEQISLAWGFKGDLEQLRRHLEVMKRLMEDAEQRHSSLSAQVKSWLQGLEEIALEADDLLDEIRYEGLRRKVEISDQLRKKVCNFFSAHNPIVFRLKMANRIKNINASFAAKNSKASQLGLQQRLVQDVSQATSSIEETHSLIGEAHQVVGREVDVSKLVDLVMRASASLPSLPVVSIVGMAGLGKTALAKLVTNHEQVQRHFDVHIWVCVSERFDVKTILRQMLQSLHATISDSKDTMLKELRESLLEKRYLLVLDDTWNTDGMKWDELRDCLLGVTNKSESVILATTRRQEVADTMGSRTDFTHKPTELTTDECWSIIKSRVYPNSSDMSLELENIGRNIAKKCKGVPLLARVIGATMRKDMTKEAWSSIQQSPLWDSLGSNDSVVRVLRLSYDRLGSPSLKKCFAYCSIFPDDTVLKREQLIQLWAAAGFLHPSRADCCQTTWDLGNKYFNDLLSNSLFQDVERDEYGDIETCKMHDSVHSLARSLSDTKILFSDNDSSVDITRIHHVNVSGRDSDDNIAMLKDTDGRNMRSLFTGFDALFFVKKFKRLRILSFLDADIDELPNSIGKLKLLRYFDISRTKIRALPDSFTKLYNLETFKAENCWKLSKLPERMENLVELSHLYIDKREELVPINIGRLTCLQTLPLFVVGVQKGRGIAELGGLGQLKGRLEIRKLELVRNKEEAMAAKLDNKKQIRKLVLRWNDERAKEADEETKQVEQHELVLDGLKPHTNLKDLRIEGYSGGKLPSWLSTTDRNPPTLLANLTRLKLSKCANCTRLPSLGHLDNLTELEIDTLPKVKSIGIEFYSDGNFPALKTFNLNDMESLEEWVWTTKLDAFPSLVDLTISSCGKLKGIPLMNGLPSLEIFELAYCKELRYIGDGLSTCTRLKELVIGGCDDLKFLPSLHRLSSLESFACSKLTSGLECLPCLTSLVALYIRDCPSTLWDGIPEQSWSCLTALQILGIGECDQLEALPKGLDNLTSLRELTIVDCPNLKSLEALPSSLKELRLSEEGSEMPPYFDSMHQYIIPTSLKLLSLTGSKKWKTLPPQIQHLTTLEQLQILGFGIEALPEWLGNLSSIQQLLIQECQDLIQLPSRDSLLRLSNLNSLYIDGCPNLKSLEALPSSLKQLWLYEGGSEREEMPPYFDSMHQYIIPTSLQFLSLTGSKKWKTLPQIQHLTTLEDLRILGFGIEALPEWLGNLSSIQQLWIRECQDLIQLPSRDSLLRLSNLNTLRIIGCPNLTERCDKERSGPEWSKISHIPLIMFDWHTIQDLKH